MKIRETLSKTLWQFALMYPGDQNQFRLLVLDLLKEIELKIDEAAPTKSAGDFLS